ncbi:MAG: hypothetical protein HYU52_06440 [Acidobacteria bacterium]|nr:hypothetical protein [Acidobacteriota bacterium]
MREVGEVLRRENAHRATRFPVTFVLANEPRLESLREVDPDRDLAYFRLGERAWVLQTYLRLRGAGLPVHLAATPPDRGLVVFHAKHKHWLARAARGRRDLVFVAIRADNSSPLLADFEVLQNDRFADGVRRFHIPFWPQPALRRRDPNRGRRLERIGYMGLLENLHRDFREGEWPRALASLGLQWAPRIAQYRDKTELTQIDWEDFRELDAVIAVRPSVRRLEFAKPASKLINAWRAGVPALIGNEYACRAIRRSEDDYLEVNNASEALAALTRLQSDPELHARMITNGRRRAAEYSFDAIADVWATLLFDTLPALIDAGALSWDRRLPLPLRLPLRRAIRILRAERSR